MLFVQPPGHGLLISAIQSELYFTQRDYFLVVFFCFVVKPTTPDCDMNFKLTPPFIQQSEGIN